MDIFCRYLATKLPGVWEHVLGLHTLNNNKQMEFNFDQDEPMTYLHQHGLGTHDRHMGCRYGEYPWKCRKRQSTKIYNASAPSRADTNPRKTYGVRLSILGVRVYSIILQRPIPKHLTFGGFNVRTKYKHNKYKHIQQDREGKSAIQKQREDESRKRDEERRRQYEEETHSGRQIKTTTATATTTRRTRIRRRT